MVGLPLSLDGSRGRAATRGSGRGRGPRGPARGPRHRGRAVRRAPDHRHRPPGARRRAGPGSGPDARWSTRPPPPSCWRPGSTPRATGRDRRGPGGTVGSAPGRRSPPGRRSAAPGTGGPGPAHLRPGRPTVHPSPGCPRPGAPPVEVGGAGGAGAGRGGGSGRHPVGPGPRPARRVLPGPRSSLTVHSGTGVDQLASALQSRGVIGSSLAYRIWGQFHGTPGVLPGSYAFDKNSSFDRGQRRDLGRAQRVRPGGPARVHRVGGGPTGGAVPGARRHLVRAPGHRRHRALPVAAGRLDQPGRPARDGRVHPGPGGDRHRPPVEDGRPVRRRGRPARAHCRGGQAGLHPVPGHHRRLHRREGGGAHEEHGPGGPGDLQPAGGGHAPADGLHRPLRRGARRRHR